MLREREAEGAARRRGVARLVLFLRDCVVVNPARHSTLNTQHSTLYTLHSTLNPSRSAFLTLRRRQSCRGGWRDLTCQQSLYLPLSALPLVLAFSLHLSLTLSLSALALSLSREILHIQCDSHYQSTLDAVNVCVVSWSEFPIVPSYPHYPHTRNPTGLLCS